MIRGSVCGAAAVLLCLSSTAQALEYSADAVFHGKQGETTTDKVFVSGPKVRLQPTTQTSYEILDTVLQTGWIVAPGKPPHVVRDPIAGQRGARYSVGPNLCIKLTIPTQPATCTKLGADTINGRAEEKWLFKRVVHGGTIVRTIWIDRALDAVVKVQSTKLDFELLNVHFGPQAASLFAVPPVAPPTQLPPKN